MVSLKYTDVSEARTASNALMIKAVYTSETSVYFNETTRRYRAYSRRLIIFIMKGIIYKT
jgi:hypothetical protein